MIQPSPNSVKGRNKNTDFLISERQSPDATQSDQINHQITESFKTLNPLIMQVKESLIKERHNSVAPRHKVKAENQSLYFSPSNMKLGLRDAIYGGSKN